MMMMKTTTTMIWMSTSWMTMILTMGSTPITKKASLFPILMEKTARMSGGRLLAAQLQQPLWITSTISQQTNSRSTGQAPLRQSTLLDQTEFRPQRSADTLVTIDLQGHRQWTFNDLALRICPTRPILFAVLSTRTDPSSKHTLRG
jgi:hypothetical protein